MEEERSLPVAPSFPAWQRSVARQHEPHTSEAFTNRSYLAYFIRTLVHPLPETTLDAYDLTVPAEQVVVFSRDGREEYASMSEWQQHHRGQLEPHRSSPVHPSPRPRDMEVASQVHSPRRFCQPTGLRLPLLKLEKEANQSYIPVGCGR